MSIVNVRFKVILLCCLVVTLITRVPDTFNLHVQIEYVLLDYSVLYIGVHTDYTHTSLLYVQIEYVFSVSGDL